MNGWSGFQRDLLEQMPLILAGLRQTLQLTVIISVTGFLFGLVVFYFSNSVSIRFLLLAMKRVSQWIIRVFMD